ncbi:MAG TPA: heme peroxidase family protein [Gaiellaceae bacterium]|nr:heme peroxidase family protein [Gaiellaceae bacterium]
MEHHGSESYFVLGEGLLGESVGGRERPLAAADEAQTPPFRFSRMGPRGIGRQLGDANLEKIGNAMAAGGGGASQIPAGYTYLGQFIDHDLTFDRTRVMLGERVAPVQLLQARSPSLDLDSLYGAGPTDPRSARFYAADGLHLKTGRTVAAEGIAAKDGFDLPRGAGTTAAAKRRAVIPDPRNDENLAVAQTHLAFIRFHNRVVDTLPSSVPPAQRFARARELVTKHYQWMIRTDYLPRICAPGIVNDVFSNGRKAFERGAAPTQVPTMPIEFSVAAFRLGHSMIRRAYNWNKIFDDGFGSLDLLFVFSAGSGDLGGSQRLPSTWIADFRRLYDFREANRANLAVPEAKFNRAMRIDTTLVPTLRDLPGFPAAEANLAFRNLTRAKMVRLGTGQQMAAFLRGKGVTLTKLTSAQIREGRNGAQLDGLTRNQRASLARDTPLWFYVLREAELNRGRLKGVGARIVAETFHRAMEGSQASIVRDPAWRPTLGPNSTTFRMVDLLLFAFEGRKALLAPLG